MIEFIKPPTDNLYKFMAIGGIALIALGVWFYLGSNGELQNRIMENNEVVLQFNVEYLNFFIPMVGDQELERLIAIANKPEWQAFDKVMEKSDEKERADYLAKLDGVAKQLRAFSEPKTALMLRQDLSKPEYKKIIMGVIRATTDQEYYNHFAQMTDAQLVASNREFNEAAKALNVKLAKIKARCVEIWAFMDGRSFAKLWLKILGIVGLILSFVGFFLWWWFVQRRLDAAPIVVEKAKSEA